MALPVRFVHAKPKILWDTLNVVEGCRWASRACFQNAKSRRGRDSNKVDPRKQLIATLVKDTFHDNDLVTVFHYNDLDSQEWKKIRLKFKQNNVKIHVFPSKVSSKALSITHFKNITPLFCGSTAVAASKDSSPSTVGRLLADTNKEDKLLLVGGIVDKQMLTPEGLQSYSRVPTIESLRQELVGILNQNQITLKRTLDSSSQRLSSLLDQVSNSTITT